MAGNVPFDVESATVVAYANKVQGFQDEHLAVLGGFGSVKDDFAIKIQGAGGTAVQTAMEKCLSKGAELGNTLQEVIETFRGANVQFDAGDQAAKASVDSKVDVSWA